MAVDTSPDFHFAGVSTSPSSPRLFPNSLSAPTSPSSIFKNSNFTFHSDHLSFPIIPSPEISTADELFHNGTILPLPLPQRGRKRTSFTPNSQNRERFSRSLSPLRDHNINTNLFPKSESGRWKSKLKDFLLFRSASEGRANGTYALFSSLFSSNFSSASGERNGGAPARLGRRRPAVSAHENHYAVNRAAAEEQRKKTPLAYQRQGFFGFIQYNPAIRSIAKGFTTSSSSRP